MQKAFLLINHNNVYYKYTCLSKVTLKRDDEYFTYANIKYTKCDNKFNVNIKNKNKQIKY
jgi:hypothetical protein